jgi:hypothetical protein
VFVSSQWDTEGRAYHIGGRALPHVFLPPKPNEPPHVHVDRDDQSAKFWLDPVALARTLGFSPVELRRIHRLVVANHSLLLEKWNERFSS